MTATQIPAKLAPLLQPRRLKIIRGGRGSGKSHTIAALKVEDGWQRPVRWLFTREVQRSIKDSVHRLLCDKIKAGGLDKHYVITDNEIRGRNGTLFLFRGLRGETMDSIKSLEGLDGTWIEEAQSVSQRSLDLLIPTIRKTGSEIWASYNPELETDPIHTMAELALSTRDPDAMVIGINLLDNPWATPELLAMRSKAYTTDPVKAAWIWGGGCRPVAEGAIYEREITALEGAGRLGNVPYDPSSDSVVAFDLGIGDHTSIIVGQFVQKEIHAVDAYENQGVALSHYIDWLKRSPYRCDTIILPHDGRSKTLQTGKSVEDQLKLAFPTSRIVVLERLDVEFGINNAREKFPNLWIDKTNGKLLVQALKKYRREFNDDTGHFEKPLHDGYSDMADAFRYLMLAPDPRPQVSIPDLSHFLPPPG